MTRNPSDIFSSTAHYYARYRTGYPPRFFEDMKGHYGLDGRGRLLDLGCGTGQMAIPFAPYFEHTFAMDPEPEMLEEGRRAESEAGGRGIEWIAGGSTDLRALADRLRPLRMVTMGSSFHWMDRDATLADLAEMVEPDGGLILSDESSARQSTADLNEFWAAALAVVRKWLGEERRAGSGTYTDSGPHETVLARSRFSRFEQYTYTYQRPQTVDGVVGLLYSTSYASRAVLGDKQAGFEANLRGTLLELSPSGEFTENAVVQAILARRD